MGFERISANALFSALVASTVFLLGFLLNGVLADFKESEKIPGEFATALESLNLEVRAIPKYHPEANVDVTVFSIAALADDLLCWLREGLSTEQLLVNYRKAHGDVVAAAVQFKGDASTLRGRLMQDLAVILQKVNRVRTIRDTTFVPLVYWMAEIASTLLFAGLVMTKTENLPESVFFLGVISFLLILLLRLINDIDNPFGQSDINSAEDVSIDLLEDIAARLKSDLPAGSAG
jgi:predicted membrane chloride channel (bestrophin family)